MCTKAGDRGLPPGMHGCSKRGDFTRKFARPSTESYNPAHHPTNTDSASSSRSQTRMATELKHSQTVDRIAELLGPEAQNLLDHTSQTISKDQLHLPGPDFIDRVWSASDRSPSALRSLQTLAHNGRLAGTGYLSILPVDQGIEHSAGASFAPNPEYFDPGNIVKLAIEGGCNAVASTFGVLGSVARKYAH